VITLERNYRLNYVGLLTADMLSRDQCRRMTMMITMMTNNYDEQATPQSVFQQVKNSPKIQKQSYK